MRALTKLLAPLYRGIKQSVRAVKLIRVNDAKSIQMIQVETLSGEIIEVPRIQDYGITSVPLPGAKGVVAAIGGNTNGYVVIKMDDKNHRLLGLKAGEVALYDHQGQMVYLKENGHIHVIANTQLTITSPLTRIEGDLVVTGDITDHIDTGGQSMSGMRSTYNAHTHPGDSGGTTGSPNQGMGL